jgi:hypothetical protein
LRVAIIGAGASGLLASIFLRKNGFHVDIFEQNDRVGKKILASGNGRCNISNRNLEKECFFGKNRDFVNPALNRFGFQEFSDFCRNISLYLDIKDDGRIYPLSNEAKSVVLSLELMAKNRGVNILTNTFISNARKNGEKFTLKADNKSFDNYDFLIVATGSKSASHLGGNSSGYEIAKSFKHEIEALYPSLAQLKLDNRNPLLRINGVKIFAKVITFIDKKSAEEVTGDILFTKYGLSGFAILDCSQAVSKALSDKKEVELQLDFLPHLSKVELENLLLSTTIENITIEHQLISLLPIKLIGLILEELNFAKEELFSSLNRKSLKKLIFKIKDFRVKIEETNGFKTSEVTGGGVDTEFIDSETMVSKNVENLYFTGEVLDIVGKRGGYNLHFAWASGFLASQSIIKNSQNKNK